MSVSGTLWNITQSGITGSFTASFNGASATSGQWTNLSTGEVGPWLQSNDVLMFKGPRYIWAGRVLDIAAMYGEKTDFSGSHTTWNAAQDFDAAKKRGKKKK
jgi:hypothetical protein